MGLGLMAPDSLSTPNVHDDWLLLMYLVWIQDEQTDRLFSWAE